MKVRDIVLLIGFVAKVSADCCGNGPVKADHAAFPRCGFGRYDPSQEFCCADTPVSKANRDVTCCNNQLIKNPTGNLLCCNKRGYDPRIEMCLEGGHVVQYVNTDRTILEHPAHRVVEVGMDGAIMSSIVGRQPFARVDSRGLSAREIKIPSTPFRPAIVRNIFGQDILMCNGKVHQLMERSQYGFYSCCGDEVYNWLYYTCLGGHRVVLVEDTQWPKTSRLHGIAASSEEREHHHENHHHKPSHHHHHHGGSSAEERLKAFSLLRHPGFEHREREGELLGCKDKRYHLRLVPVLNVFRCCGERLLDSTKFGCSAGYEEPHRVAKEGQLAKGGKFLDVALGDVIVVP